MPNVGGEDELFDAVRRLGRGSFGETWLVRKRGLEGGTGAGPLFAVKIPRVPEDVIGSRDEEDTRQRVLQSLIHEAFVLARLDSDNIVRVHEVELFQGEHALVMDYIEGSTLRDLLDERRKAWPVQGALAIAVDVARGLAAAHARGVIHKDIKPENIMIRAADGRAVIIDFGVAKLREALRPHTQVMLTPPYAAPEQIEGVPTDASVDCYALGCVLFEMLNARRPFSRSEGRLKAHVDAKRQGAVEGFQEHVPDVLRQAILAALDPDRRKRPATAAAMLEALLKLVSTPHTAQPAKAGSNAAPTMHRQPAAAVSQSARQALELAHQYTLEQRHAEAVSVLRQALVAHPKDADLHYRLGLALLKLDDTSAARTELEVARELWRGTAAAGGHERRLQLVSQHLRRLGATASPADAPGASVEAARALLAEHDYQGAAEMLRRILVQRPDDARVHHTMADALSSLGRAGEAVEHLRRSLLGGLNVAERRRAAIKLKNLEQRLMAEGPTS